MSSQVRSCRACASRAPHTLPRSPALTSILFAPRRRRANKRLRARHRAAAVTPEPAARSFGSAAGGQISRAESAARVGGRTAARLSTCAHLPSMSTPRTHAWLASYGNLPYLAGVSLVALGMLVAAFLLVAATS